MKRRWMLPLMEVLGFGAVSLGLYMAFHPAGIVAAGLTLVIVAIGLENRGEDNIDAG